MIDVIKIDVPTFIRLLELAREDIKDDADLHIIADAVNAISQETVVTMDHYNDILSNLQQQSADELNDIKRNAGLN